MKSALKSIKVFKPGGPWDSGEKKAKVEVLFRSGMGMIHPVYGKTWWFPFSPLVCLGIQIEKKATGIILWQSSICLKPSYEGGGTISMLSNNILAIFIFTKDNSLLLIKMSLKVNYIGKLLLHVKEIELP